MNQKAQVSVDFTITIMIAMIFFLIILYSAHSQRDEMDSVVLSLDAKHVSEKFALAINDVYLAGNGAVRNITLPKKLYGGKIYTLRVYPRSVLINYSSAEGDKGYAHRILTKDVDGCGNGLHVIPGGIQITNSDGTIYLSPVVPGITTTTTAPSTTSTTTTSTSTTTTTTTSSTTTTSTSTTTTTSIPEDAGCLTIHTDLASIGGGQNDKLQGIDIENTCGYDIVLNKTRVTWTPDNGEGIEKVKIDNHDKWEHDCGWGCSPAGRQSSGTLLDFGSRDYTLPAGSTKDVNEFTWNKTDMNNKYWVIEFTLEDGSTKNATINMS